MSETFTIYRLINTTKNKTYIGAAKNSKKRIGNHFYLLRNEKHENSHLQEDYSNGDCFEFHILEDSISIVNIKDRENHWINVFNSIETGYNNALSGMPKTPRNDVCDSALSKMRYVRLPDHVFNGLAQWAKERDLIPLEVDHRRKPVNEGILNLLEQILSERG